MHIQSTDRIWCIDEWVVGIPPPKLRLLPKWRSIPMRPRSGTSKVWKRSTFILIWARGRPGMVHGVIISGCLLLLLALVALLHVEAKQPKLLVQLLLQEWPRSPANTEQTRNCGKGSSLSSPSVNNILWTRLPAQELAVTKWWIFIAARSSLCGTNNISLGATERPKAATMHAAIMPP
jgi:hypothetical protein